MASRYWDRIARKYDEMYTDAYSKREDLFVQDLIVSLLPSTVGPILELGCGTGLGYAMLPETWRRHYVGLDASSEMLAVAGERFPGAAFERFDLENLANFPGEYQCVFCINGVGSYVSDPYSLVTASSKLLGTGGRIMLSYLNQFALRRLILLSLSVSEPLKTRRDISGEELGQQNLVRSSRLIEVARKCQLTGLRVHNYGLFGGIWETALSSAIERLPIVRSIPLGHAKLFYGERMKW